MTVELINILKLRKLSILCDKYAILMILEIELQNTLLNVKYVERTKFREINNMMK